MKTIDISIVGFGDNELKPFRRSNVDRLSIFPILELAQNHFSRNNHFGDVIFVKYNSYFNSTKSFLELLKEKNEYASTVVILISEKESLKPLHWFFEKNLVDDIFDTSFDLNQGMQRVLGLLSLKREGTSKSKKISFSVKTPTAKRVFDVIVASSLLIVLSPLLITVAIIVAVESGFPFYYTSKRVGTGYKIFDFYKFRSMKKNADKQLASLKTENQYSTNTGGDIKECSQCKKSETPCSPLVYSDERKICEAQFYREKRNKTKGTFIKIANDPRVTKFGRFIRNTSIDELPQLINVLKGDMSIVGNRPLPLYEAELLTTDKWAERFNAPAGITGLWQVEKRGAGAMSESERKELDNKYARKSSVITDIKLLFKTIPALLQKESV